MSIQRAALPSAAALAPVVLPQQARAKHPARWVGVLVAAAFVGLQFEQRGIVLRPFDGLMLLGLAVLVARAAVTGTLPRVRLLGDFGVLAAYFGYRALNALVLSSAKTAGVEFLRGLEILFLILLIARTTRTDQGRRAFLSALTVSLGLLAIATAVYHAAHGEYYNFKSLNTPKLSFGVVAILWFASDNGRELFRISRSRRRVISLATLVLLAAAGDRKGWVAFAVASLAVVWVPIVRRHVRPRDARRVVAFVGVAMLVVIAAMLANQYSSDEFYTARQIRSLAEIPDSFSSSPGDLRGSDYSRGFLVRSAGEILLAHPVIGVGPDGFKEAIALRAEAAGTIPHNPHNEYLKVAVETGVLGLTLFLGACAALMRSAYRLLRDRGVRGGDPVKYGRILAALLLYGATVNLFLAGGLLNPLFVAVPLGLVMGAWQEESQGQPEALEPAVTA